eukprot:15383019-Alexandrium_andersonii.AAC.1
MVVRAQRSAAAASNQAATPGRARRACRRHSNSEARGPGVPPKGRSRERRGEGRMLRARAPAARPPGWTQRCAAAAAGDVNAPGNDSDHFRACCRGRHPA